MPGSAALRVMFVLRPDASARPGGDVVQALSTARALEALGVTVEIAETTTPDPRGFDIAHIFGVFEPDVSEPQMDACRKAGARIALSPIWWDLSEFVVRARECERVLRGKPARIDPELLKLRATPTGKLTRGRDKVRFEKRLQRQAALMRSADVLLPNSATEAHAYAETLGISAIPTVVVCNATDARAYAGRMSERSGIVCVGRLEPRKNQAMLLYALRDLDVEITLVGLDYDAEYSELCDRFTTPRVKRVGPLPHHDVFALLARSAVHVLPSWLETPGIASLEAAAAGARMVIGGGGCEFDYFGHEAAYVDPGDPGSIRSAVERALAAGPRSPSDGLDQRMAGFTWAHAAAQTLRAYRLLAPAPRGKGVLYVKQPVDIPEDSANK
jgi:glycosyltransferase involved in cell wall biosynthesis